ncbi:MAG TPA: hypothetical protein PK264_21495, partial [Hyphomicrobiaceae bacterium]|nr:hypothetical protein [Hyphomicrobiaceae bacterium]
AMSYVLRGEARVRLGEADAARADFTAAIRIMPANARALADRARLAKAAGDCAGAIADFDSAIRITPNDASLIAERRLCVP